MSEDGVAVKLRDDMEILNSNKLRNSLVIKVFGKEIPSYLVAWAVRKQWKLFGNFHFTTLGRGWFLCSFGLAEMMEGVLMGGPWFENGHIIGMEKWTAGFSTLSMKGLTSSIWIRLPHLPLQCWAEINMARIVAMVGRPLMQDGNMFQWGRFFRRVEYERISTFSYKCGLVGHLKADCKKKGSVALDGNVCGGNAKAGKEVEMHPEEDNCSTYGPWIMVNRKSFRR
ncbi:uncharacterized protein LOC110095663 [Dendrobium catenatum]|uniref:uncharacterized protein LOC110095663 n=1 Tax=Dendrobium catenatum TaxID=906689 RepID=UPI00109F975F|nr:uncharacterized protein LOC110095663 [Dendrobium catenatum]